LIFLTIICRKRRSNIDFAREKIFMGLRLKEGIDMMELQEKHGVKIFEEALLNLKKEGLIKWENSRIKLTLRGKLVHTQVVAYLWDNLTI
jgi:oxygen-independent coproporphyrinogen-3 oxidase